MKKILITGAKGMVGTELSEYLENNDFKVIRTDVSELDITNANAIDSILKDDKPDFLINCAAYTNVNAAEDEGKELNYKLNAEAPKLLAQATKVNNVKLLHISTDYVFGGNTDEGYEEDQEPKSQYNEYGKAKREGEINVMETNPDAYICRTSWIFGKYGRNYVEIMLQLAEDRDELSIVKDEIGVPTSVTELVRQLKYMIDNITELKPGYYHIVNEGSASRFEQSKKIFELAGIDIKLTETTLEAYGRSHMIPNYSILKNTKLPKLMNWEDALADYLENRKA